MTTTSCKICLYEYDRETHRPVVGSCGHTICSLCSARIQNQCPTCRATSFENAPTNFEFIEHIEAERSTQEQVNPTEEVRTPAEPNNSTPPDDSEDSFLQQADITSLTEEFLRSEEEQQILLALEESKRIFQEQQFEKQLEQQQQKRRELQQLLQQQLQQQQHQPEQEQREQLQRLLQQQLQPNQRQELVTYRTNNNGVTETQHRLEPSNYVVVPTLKPMSSTTTALLFSVIFLFLAFLISVLPEKAKIETN